MSFLKLKYGSRIRKPSLILRVFKSYLKMYLFRRVHLRYVNIGFDYTCNFKCEHCFAECFRKANKKQMTVEDHKNFARQAMKMGVYDFSFQGGEPFLPASFELLKKIVKAYEPKKNIISVVTNGMFVTEQKLRELKRLGVDILTVSIDSGIEEEHDRFRGIKGSYSRAIEAVNLARKNGMNVIINTTFSHQNLKSEGIKRILEFAEQEGLLLNSLLAVPIGRWKESREVTLTEEDWQYYRELQKEYSCLKRDIGFSFFKYGCGAVKEMIYLTAYGDVCPCPFIHISIGNVLEEPLEKIIERGLQKAYFASYHPKCLVAEDYEFLEKYLQEVEDAENLPLPVSKARFLVDVNRWDEVWKKTKKPTFIGKASQNAVYKILQDFFREIPKEAKVIDVGCGSGLTLKFLRGNGFVNSIGIDNSREALKRCVEKGFVVGKDVFLMDALKTPYPDEFFELVFSWGLLEHFADYSPYVNEMIRICSRYVVLVQPNLHSFYGRMITSFTNILGRGVKEHPYKIEEFVKAFEQRGFKLVKSRATPLGEFKVLVFEKFKGN